MAPATSIKGLADVPLRAALSARYQNTFAYPTIKDRCPVILCKVIDHLYRERNNIGRQLGEEAQEGLKSVVEELSKLRYEMQTNKPVTPLEETESDDDISVWNSYLVQQKERESNSCTWYTAPWLWVECYMYRRISQAVFSVPQLRSFDVFRSQKEEGMLSSLSAMRQLGEWWSRRLENLDVNKDQLEDWQTLLEVCLWGNKCDLSISAGSKMAASGDPVQGLKKLKSNILLDQGKEVWDCLQSRGGKNLTVDIVMDNSGFELFTDLCLADFLVSSKVADKVRMRIKDQPWFVSDTTPTDLNWSLAKLVEDVELSRLGRRWTEHFSSGTWSSVADPFWTFPHDFSQMKETDVTLYNTLGQADLVIFKGDLNYRKLVGDLNWETTVSFATALQVFRPAPILSLRTAKADVMVGLATGQAEEVTEKDPEWMVNGQWGVIQFADLPK